MISELRALRRNEARVSGIHQGPQATACNNRPDINLQPHLSIITPKNPCTSGGVHINDMGSSAPPRFSKVIDQSAYIQELNQFRAWLEAAHYTPMPVHEHTIRLARTLGEMDRAPGAVYTSERLHSSFDKHNATPVQLRNYRSTQRCFAAFLQSKGRLVIPAIEDRFAALRNRYLQELAEVRGFSRSTLKNHRETMTDFLRRGLRPRQQLRTLTSDDVDHYVALRSTRLSRQSLQHTVAALRSFLRHLHDRGEIPSRLDRIDTPRAYRGELLPKALHWQAAQRLLRTINRQIRTGERDYAILHLMTHYGLRPSEIVSLRLDSIDWQENTLCVEQCKTRRSTL